MEKDSKLVQVGRDAEKNIRMGISTTNSNDKVVPRKSTSEEALMYALDYAKNEFGAESSGTCISNIVRDTIRKMPVRAYFHVQFQRWIRRTK
jgi:hypothetical protein